MNVIILPEAEIDLEEIGDLISSDAPRRAVSFVHELRSSALNLEDAPLAYPLVPGYERPGIRRRVYGNYIIFYNRSRADIHTSRLARRPRP